MKRWGLTAGLIACGPRAEMAEPVIGTSSTTSTAETSVSTGESTSSSPGLESLSPGETSGSETGLAIVSTPDLGGASSECDLWSQDCPPGEKCMPWANDGGNSWNATRCSPIELDPKGVGQPCSVVGSGVSGIDDCGGGAMCWNVDPDTGLGECVAFCQGSEANPTCTDPCTSCFINGEGVLILCLPGCDPLAQDCSEGEGCYHEANGFYCSPDASGEAGAAGSPCEYLNVCDAGLFCADEETVPGCPGGFGCCAPFCNVDAPDVCDALLPGTSCVPWFEEGQGPEACLMSGTIGACVATP